MSPFERRFHFRQITIIMNFVAVLSVAIKRVDCSNLKWSIARPTCVLNRSYIFGQVQDDHSYIYKALSKGVART